MSFMTSEIPLLAASRSWRPPSGTTIAFKDMSSGSLLGP